MAPRGVTSRIRPPKKPPDPHDSSDNPQNGNNNATSMSSHSSTTNPVLTPPPPRNLPRGSTFRRVKLTPPSASSLSHSNTPSSTMSEYQPRQLHSFQSRRPGTFYGTPPTSRGGDGSTGWLGGSEGGGHVPRLRRGSTMFMVTPGKEGGNSLNETHGKVIGALNRGSAVQQRDDRGTPAGSSKEVGEMRRVQEMTERKEREKKLWEEEGKLRWKCCGMCGACGKLPEWAPERLRGKGREGERERVRRVMNEKEERGKLERRIRERRVEERMKVEREQVGMEVSEAFGKDDIESGSEEEVEKAAQVQKLGDKEESEVDGHASGQFSQIDLESEDEMSTSAKPDPGRGIEGDPMQMVGSIALSNGVRGVESSISEDDSRVRGSSMHSFHDGGRDSSELECEACKALEAKIKDLEEQVGLLKRIVDITKNDKMGVDSEKKNKGWRVKMLGGYYGAGSSTSEKNRLKEEADALRKATDVLFSKLRDSDMLE